MISVKNTVLCGIFLCLLQFAIEFYYLSLLILKINHIYVSNTR